MNATLNDDTGILSLPEPHFDSLYVTTFVGSTTDDHLNVVRESLGHEIQKSVNLLQRVILRPAELPIGSEEWVLLVDQSLNVVNEKLVFHFSQSHQLSKIIQHFRSNHQVNSAVESTRLTPEGILYMWNKLTYHYMVSFLIFNCNSSSSPPLHSRHTR